MDTRTGIDTRVLFRIHPEIKDFFNVAYTPAVLTGILHEVVGSNARVSLSHTLANIIVPAECLCLPDMPFVGDTFHVDGELRRVDRIGYTRVVISIRAGYQATFRSHECRIERTEGVLKPYALGQYVKQSRSKDTILYLGDQQACIQKTGVWTAFTELHEFKPRNTTVEALKKTVETNLKVGETVFFCPSMLNASGLDIFGSGSLLTIKEISPRGILCENKRKITAHINANDLQKVEIT